MKASLRQGTLGGILGMVFGAFLQAFLGLNIDPNEHRFFPWSGVGWGGATGVVVGICLHNVRVPRRLSRLVITSFAGMAFGAVFGWLIAFFLPAHDDKDRTENTLTCMAIFVPAGLVFGAMIGISKRPFLWNKATAEGNPPES